MSKTSPERLMYIQFMFYVQWEEIGKNKAYTHIKQFSLTLKDFTFLCLDQKNYFDKNNSQ